MRQVGVAHHAHDHRAGVPPAGNQAAVHRRLCGALVDMERLRIELLRKGDHFILLDAFATDLLDFPDLEIFPIPCNQRLTPQEQFTAMTQRKREGRRETSKSVGVVKFCPRRFLSAHAIRLRSYAELRKSPQRIIHLALLSFAFPLRPLHPLHPLRLCGEFQIITQDLRGGFSCAVASPSFIVAKRVRWLAELPNSTSMAVSRLK